MSIASNKTLWRLKNCLEFIYLRRGDSLARLAVGPADDGALHLRVLAQTEMQAMIVLGAEAAGGTDFLQLRHFLAPRVLPIQPHLRADGIPVGMGALQVKLNPVTARRDGIFVQQQWPALGGDHYV